MNLAESIGIVGLEMKSLHLRGNHMSLAGILVFLNLELSELHVGYKSTLSFVFARRAET